MMVRLACSLGLVALAILVLFVSRLEGATAIVFVFVGIPSLALALTIYVVYRWRAGAFRFNETSRVS